MWPGMALKRCRREFDHIYCFVGYFDFDGPTIDDYTTAAVYRDWLGGAVWWATLLNLTVSYVPYVGRSTCPFSVPIAVAPWALGLASAVKPNNHGAQARCS